MLHKKRKAGRRVYAGTGLKILIHHPLPLLRRQLQGLDDAPVNHAGLVLRVVLKAVNVAWWDVERVPLLEQLSLSHVVIPLPLAWICYAQLDCVNGGG